MAFFRKKESLGCVFLKEDSSAQKLLAQLSELRQTPAIEKEIRLIRFGEAGEDVIRYELQSSGLDMYVLHDLFLEGDGYNAQIDYLLIMEKAIVILECKNLIGDVTIDENGAFTRSYLLGKQRVKEGIYSPIAQNERHKRVLHDLMQERQTGFLARRFFEERFEYRVYSFVVFANAKTCLDMQQAPAEVKKAVLRADQLVARLQDIAKNSDAVPYTAEDMRALGELFLSHNAENPMHYAKRFEVLAALAEAEEKEAAEAAAEPVPAAPEAAPAETPAPEEKICPRCGAKLVLRKASKGKNAGNRFWGCSSYPKCRYIERL